MYIIYGCMQGPVKLVIDKPAWYFGHQCFIIHWDDLFIREHVSGSVCTLSSLTICLRVKYICSFVPFVSAICFVWRWECCVSRCASFIWLIKDIPLKRGIVVWRLEAKWKNPLSAFFPVGFVSPLTPSHRQSLVQEGEPVAWKKFF